ncbi:MAG: hypothetical protein AB1634_16325 [Thermodesulfobacteriota bacterium]
MWLRKLAVTILGLGLVMVQGGALAEPPAEHGAASHKGDGEKGGMMAMMHHGEGGEGGMMAGMPMMHREGGMMAGMPMMHGKGGDKGADGKPRAMGMGMGGNMPAAGIMHAFHRWLGKVMASQEELGLTREQLDRIDELITPHLQEGIRLHAEAAGAMVQFQYLMRHRSEDVAAIDPVLRKLADIHYQLLLGGVQLYNGIMTSLAPSQRDKIRETIGSPFPPPWEGMSMPMSMPMPMMMTMPEEAPAASPPAEPAKEGPAAEPPASEGGAHSSHP